MPSNQPHFKNIGKTKIATSSETAEHSYAHRTIVSLVILHSLCWTALNIQQTWLFKKKVIFQVLMNAMSLKL